MSIQHCQCKAFSSIDHYNQNQYQNETDVPSQQQQQQHLVSEHRNHQKRPLMYTYFERIPLDRRFTDMTDDDDDALLAFWNTSWTMAGWDPIILGRDHARRHANYEAYESNIQTLRLDDFAQISLRRYIAMAAMGGGWISDYDVFPIRDFRTMLPGNKFTLYNIITPSLALGTQQQWEDILHYLLQDALQYINKNETQLNMWTDTLSMYTMLRLHRIQSHRRTMPGSMLMPPTPWTNDYCTSRAFRKPYLVVHVDPKSMLEGQTIIPSAQPQQQPQPQRLPKFRAVTAAHIIPRLKQHCGIHIINKDEDDDDGDDEKVK